MLQVLPPSVLTSTRARSSSDQAQPQISTGVPRLCIAPGLGATITDCGATAQTGTISPGLLGSGSLYQRVVNAPVGRVCARVMRLSHFTLFVP